MWNDERSSVIFNENLELQRPSFCKQVSYEQTNCIQVKENNWTQWKFLLFMAWKFSSRKIEREKNSIELIDSHQWKVMIIIFDFRWLSYKKLEWFMAKLHYFWIIYFVLKKLREIFKIFSLKFFWIIKQ